MNISKLALNCLNCHTPFIYVANSEAERTHFESSGAYCDTCCKVANTFFESDYYKEFENSENEYSF
jgi:hypothetical protein